MCDPKRGQIVCDPKDVARSCDPIKDEAITYGPKEYIIPVLTLLVNECVHPSKLSGNGPRLITVTLTVGWGKGRGNVSSRRLSFRPLHTS